MNLTIDKKTGLFISLLIFVLGTILGFFLVRAEIAVRNRELNERAKEIVEEAVYHLEYPVLVRDQAAIRQGMEDILNHKDVIFCLVEDKEGEVLYRQGTEKGGPVRKFSSPLVNKRAEEAEDLLLNVPREIVEKIGRVTLYFSLAGLEQSTFETTRAVILGGLMAMLLTSLGSYLLLRRLIGQPVEKLVRATERIAGGDLTHQVDLNTGDEFEWLGNSFDQMTESLRTAQEELLRRERLTLLDQLAGSVGNELRNPLGVMTNAVFFLESILPDADETVQEYLGIIRSEIEGSQRILSDFIDFFRLRPPRRRGVAVGELIASGLGKQDIPESVTVAVNIPPVLPPVWVDPDQIEQVYKNLSDNALQAMPDGGSLRISAKIISDSGPHDPDLRPEGQFMAVSISDTGEGIPAENMKKIFQPLYSTRARGIGLGLSVCQNLVGANGGWIEVTSRPGEGATFSVMLPLAENN